MDKGRSHRLRLAKAGRTPEKPKSRPRSPTAQEQEGETLRKMVLPDRIELSTSPLPMECSTTELRQRAPDQENRPKRPLQGGPILATRPGDAQARGPVRNAFQKAKIMLWRPRPPSLGSIELPFADIAGKFQFGVVGAGHEGTIYSDGSEASRSRSPR
jgi:hypothetical protein